jgi:uncharacterized protein YpmB
MFRKVLADKLSDKLSEEQAKKTLKVLVEKKTYLVFLYLIGNSPFVDVKGDSLRMVFYIASQKGSQQLSEVDLAAYIGSVLWNVN